MGSLSPAELVERLRSPQPPRLLDVRQPEEHRLVALPDSRLVPLPDLPDRWPELADWHESEVVVYCHHGIRSRQAIGLLRAVGFTRLWNLDGGIDAWSRVIDPRLPRY